MAIVTSEATNLASLGNGVGYIYITDEDKVCISTLNNSPSGRDVALADALIKGQLASEQQAFGIVEVTAAAGSISNLTVNGVAIIGAAATGATTALQAADLASKINSYTSVPDYTAVAIDSKCYIYALPGTGSTPNGYVVTSTVVAPTTTTDTDMAGGNSGNGRYADNYGHRYFYNPSSSAQEGIVGGSQEITRYFINRGLQNQIYKEDLTISGGALEFYRNASIVHCVIETEGAAATDDLRTIFVTGAQVGDLLIIRGKQTGNVTTFKDYSSGSDNIYLNNSLEFSTGDPSTYIILKYDLPDGGSYGWYEVSRAAVQPTVSVLRSNNISIPVQGTTDTTLVAGGGTITLIPGTDKEFQVLLGSPILVASYSVIFGGSPKDGDRFIIYYKATATTGTGQTVTIAGITLTETQMGNGKSIVIAEYDSTGATWRSVLLPDESTRDLVDTVDLATKEDSLGNPAADGYVLTSTVAGVRSWSNLPNPILHNDVSNSGTTAIITEEILKTYTLPGGTLDSDGDALYVEAVLETAANANNKTINLKFGVTTLVSTGAIVSNNSRFIIKATITRVSSTSQYCFAEIFGYEGVSTALVTAATFGGPTSPGETLSADVDLVVTGQNGVAAANDIICKSLMVYNLNK